MAQGSDSNDTCYTGSPSPDIQQDSMDNVKKVMRREKNRVAAQKSRMRQTQKADSLHLVCCSVTNMADHCRRIEM
nr:basic leucine zipper transcriptional factor ATF-like isoform X2 [Paramormyrops kingsleyae]